jgi:Spy/CpxP family protein refolding chaperone
MSRFDTTKRALAASAMGGAALAATIALAQPPGYGPGPGYGPPAQTAGGNADWVAARLDRMGWGLGLTAEQKAQLKPILEERLAMRSAQREAMRKQLAQILTPAQLAHWDQMRGQRGRGRGPCGG